MSALFTSEAACNAVARREIRNKRHDINAAFNNLIHVILPLAKSVVWKGKVQRGKLRPIAKAISDKLGTQPNVVGVKFHTLAGELSTREAYEVTFVQAASLDPTDNCMDFIGCRITINRRQIEIYLNQTMFSVNSHVLSRYMIRERKDVKTFYTDILRPLRLAMPISLRSLNDHFQTDVALPFASGLLLGEVDFCKHKAGQTALRYLIDADGPHDPEIVDNVGPIPGCLISFNMRTYADNDALFPNMEIIRNRLAAYEAEHREALDNLFEAFLFDKETSEGYWEYREAMDAAIEIVNTPEWQRYLASRAAAA